MEHRINEAALWQLLKRLNIAYNGVQPSRRHANRAD